MIKLLGAPDKQLVKEINLNEVLIVKDIWVNEFLMSNDKEVTEGEIEFTTKWNKEVYFKYKVEIIQFLNSDSEVIIAVNDISREKAIEKELSYLSFNDGMTGLYNRRYFENELERLNHSRKLPISIIIGDLDGLKYINDHFGHKTGDKYIIKLAEIMKNSFREADIAARIGGDEFAIILPDTDSKKAEEIAERLKDKCDKYDGYENFGISVGHATKTEYYENLEDIFIKADKELYKDKKSK